MGRMHMLDAPLKRVRPSEVEWEPLGTHGLRRKLLGFDAATNHITSIVGIPPGWVGGRVAHYHHAFEEVYILEGSVTVGGTHYWHKDDYFFRPAHVVHGHDEKSQEGALALTRSDGVLQLLLIHEPAEPDEYPLPEYNDARGHLKDLPVDSVASIVDSAFPESWRIKPLSANPQTDARTIIVEIPAGWKGEAPTLGVDWEAFVLKGSLDGAAGEFAAEDYTAGHGDTPFLGATRSEAGCSVLLWQFGRE